MKTTEHTHKIKAGIGLLDVHVFEGQFLLLVPALGNYFFFFGSKQPQ